MQRLFSCLLIFSCVPLCCDLLRFVRADDAVASALCNSATKSLECANLGNVSYPFGDAEPCAASDSFLLNCSSPNSQAYWDAFTQALIGSDGDEDHLGAPAVEGIFQSRSLSFINLTWDLEFTLEQDAVCRPLLANTANAYVPEVINLTSFANGSFQLSFYNYILLLNCSGFPSSLPLLDVAVNNTVCRDYQDQCSVLQDTPCAQVIVPTHELMLQQALSNYSCTHFQFLIAAEDSIVIPSWSQGLIQLFYGDTLCQACYHTGGSCIYDNTTTHAYKECACGNNQFSDTDCLHIHSCKGFACNTGAKITVGLVGAVMATVTVIGIAALTFRKMLTTRGHFTKMVARRSTRQKLFGSSGLIIHQLDLDQLTERPIEYQYASIALATKSFNDLLGEGGFGAVYKGILGNVKDDVHVQIAVKVLEMRSKHSKKHFLNEVASIGRIHHVHVVRLLGFCIEENHEMLVYEYVSNGSLDKWLFHHSRSQGGVLPWEQRYAIAIGVAKGLSYLHEECRHRIVHCDIKPQNILLDEQMCPKIADFGLARLMGREESRVATMARGTPGYMGPEFWLGGESELSTKFDVYSYGMVLLELISGQRNFGHGVYFPEMAFEAAMGGNLESIMDIQLGSAKTRESMKWDGVQWPQVQTALLVALWCIQDHPTNRPSMSEVVQYLEGIAAINEQPPRPTIASYSISNGAQRHLYVSNDLHDDITPISGER